MQFQPEFVKSMVFAKQTLNTWFKKSAKNAFNGFNPPIGRDKRQPQWGNNDIGINGRTLIWISIVVVGTTSASPANFAGFSAGCFPSGLGLSGQPKSMCFLPSPQPFCSP